MTETHRKMKERRLADDAGDGFRGEAGRAALDVEYLNAPSSWLTPLHDALALARDHARRLDAQNAVTRTWQRNGGWVTERGRRS